MSEKIMFTGTVIDGVLKVSNRKQFDQEVKTLEGMRIEGYVWKAKKRRSLSQNAYYFGVVLPACLRGFKYLGHERLDIETLHAYFKARYIDEPEQIASPHSGEVITLTKTTTNLTTTQMNDYIEAIRRFAAEFLGISIPDPTPIFSNQNA